MEEGRTGPGDEVAVDPEGSPEVRLAALWSDRLSIIRELLKGHRDALIEEGWGLDEATAAASVVHDYAADHLLG